MKADSAKNVKKREEKATEKQQTAIQKMLFKSLGPEQSPVVGPLGANLGMAERRKFSLDMDYKEKVRNQDLMSIMKNKLQVWLA